MNFWSKIMMSSFAEDFAAQTTPQEREEMAYALTQTYPDGFLRIIIQGINDNRKESTR